MGLKASARSLQLVAILGCTAGLLPRVASVQTVPPRPSPQRAPTLSDLPRLREFGQLAVSADGRWVAYALTAPFRMAGQDGMGSGVLRDDLSAITLLDLRTNRTTALALAGSPRSLQWSPGAATLAFLMESDGVQGLWRYSPLEEAAAPTRIEIADSIGGPIQAFAWSPAGDSIAYLASEEARHHDAATEDEQPKLVLFHDAPGKYSGPRQLSYATDSMGVYLSVAPSGGGSGNVLARHVVSFQAGPELAWSSRGSLLVNGVLLGVDYWSKSTIRVMYVFDPIARVLRRISPEGARIEVPEWSPSGRHIAFLSATFLPDGRGPAFSRTLGIQDLGLSGSTRMLSRIRDGLTYALPPVWGVNDSTLYIARYANATARLYAVDVPTGRWRALTPDSLSVSRYTISRDRSTLIAVLESANLQAELYRISLVDGSLARLTHRETSIADLRLGRVDEVSWGSADGRFRIHGFLVKPPDYDSTKRYPLVVQVHGGPGAFWTNTFIDINFAPQYIPPQLLASAGYLVLLPNPRGDPSYGETFQEALRLDWGPGPFGDVDAGVDSLIARGLADSTRIGIAGLSYGGYLAAYAITQTSRYKAASINDGPVNLESEYGQNYATRALVANWYFGGPPWSRPEIYARQSPISFVTRVRTPVLMRYGGMSSTHDDVRQSYMLAQGFELYAALRDNHVPVEFVLHPGEGHGIHDWMLYQDWIRRNVRWFDYWLNNEGVRPPVGKEG